MSPRQHPAVHFVETCCGECQFEVAVGEALGLLLGMDFTLQNPWSGSFVETESDLFGISAQGKAPKRGGENFVWVKVFWNFKAFSQKRCRFDARDCELAETLFP